MRTFFATHQQKRKQLAAGRGTRGRGRGRGTRGRGRGRGTRGRGRGRGRGTRGRGQDSTDTETSDDDIGTSSDEGVSDDDGGMIVHEGDKVSCNWYQDGDEDQWYDCIVISVNVKSRTAHVRACVDGDENKNMSWRWIMVS